MSDSFDWSKIDKSWGEAASGDKGSASKGVFDTVPDGPYSVVIDKAEFKNSKAGNPYLNLVLVVQSGPHEGRWLFKRCMLSTSQNMTFLKKDLAVCGVKVPERISELNLESLLDRKLKVTKKTKDDFENIYFDNLIESFDMTPKQGATDLAKRLSDEDIPF